MCNQRSTPQPEQVRTGVTAHFELERQSIQSKRLDPNRAQAIGGPRKRLGIELAIPNGEIMHGRSKGAVLLGTQIRNKCRCLRRGASPNGLHSNEGRPQEIAGLGPASDQCSRGGIQFLAFAPKPGRFADEPPERAFGSSQVCYSMAPPSAEMGLGAGGRMRQSIYPDGYGATRGTPTTPGGCSFTWRTR